MGMRAIDQLEAHWGRISRLDDAIAMLQWDMAAMMPSGGAEARTEQLANLRLIRHDLACDARIGEWLGEVDSTSVEPWQAVNADIIRRRWLHDTALDPALVEAISRACDRCELEWRTARKDNDFARLRPHLEEVVRLVREEGAAKAEKLGCSPYAALLDQYDPGRSVASIDGLFDELAAVLPGLIEDVLDHQARQPAIIELPGPFPVDAQRSVGRKLMGALGFDFEHGRLDVSHHPFCGGSPDDVRITTRYAEHDFTQALMGVIHETGHALYERGLPSRWRYQPVGRAISMTVHESQSLLMEMQACRTRAFIEFCGPLLREAFAPDGGPAWSVDNLHRVYTRVTRGLIRVDADEVTYPAHVIMRYRLEKALMAGSLQVADLPEAWRAGLLELVGIEPPDDKDGCMQDVHWVSGLFGYFPTYTLGAMAAAQLFGAAREAMPDLEDRIGRGDFAPLLAWLRENVHVWGSRYGTDDLLQRATGAPLGTEAFLGHLRSRYLGA